MTPVEPESTKIVLQKEIATIQETLSLFDEFFNEFLGKYQKSTLNST